MGEVAEGGKVIWPYLTSPARSKSGYAAKVKSIAARMGCTVERVPVGCKGDPDIEILAPEGFWFPDAGTHTLLCHGWDDAHARLSGEGRMERCAGDCCA